MLKADETVNCSMEGLEPVKDPEKKASFLHLKDLTAEMVMGVYAKPSGDVENVLKLQDLRLLLGKFPEYEHSMWEWGQFYNRKHRLSHFQPSTRLGMFDVELDAASQTVVIRCRLHFRFIPGNWLAFPEAQPEELAWTEGEKFAWKKQFLTQANVKWSGRHRIWCQRDWWESYRLRARVIFEEVEDQPHFHFRVAKVPRYIYEGVAASHYSWVRAPQPGGLEPYQPGIAYTHSNALQPAYAGAHSEAMHLTGHLIGLADEDVPGGNPVHDWLAQKLQVGAAHEGVDDRMMSRGERITDAYAAPIVEALAKLTGSGPWGLHRKRSRPVPWDNVHRPGDYWVEKDDFEGFEKKEAWK